MTKVYWLGANEQRSADAARRHIEEIEAALADPHPRTSQRELVVARLRRDNPTLTLRQIAEANGMTKDEFAAVLNRFLRRHRRQPAKV